MVNHPPPQKQDRESAFHECVHVCGMWGLHLSSHWSDSLWFRLSCHLHPYKPAPGVGPSLALLLRYRRLRELQVWSSGWGALLFAPTWPQRLPIKSIVFCSLVQGGRDLEKIASLLSSQAMRQLIVSPGFMSGWCFLFSCVCFLFFSFLHPTPPCLLA